MKAATFRDYTRYKATDCGGVLSKDRPLKPKTRRDGYQEVMLYKGGRGRMFRLHRLILEAFKGACPEGMICRHLDGNTLNNKLDNLAWGTEEENAEDRRKHGTMPMGSKHAGAKLDEAKLAEAKRLRNEEGWTYRRLAGHFGVNVCTIFRAVTGQKWKQEANE